MSLHAAVLRDVLLVTTLSKTYSRLCIHWTDSPIEYNVQTPPINSDRPMKTTFLLLFFILMSCKIRTGDRKNPVGKLIIRKAVF